MKVYNPLEIFILLRESLKPNINYAIGKCFSCGTWLGGTKDKYCREHEGSFSILAVLPTEQEARKLCERFIVPAIRRHDEPK